MEATATAATSNFHHAKHHQFPSLFPSSTSSPHFPLSSLLRRDAQTRVHHGVLLERSSRRTELPRNRIRANCTLEDAGAITDVFLVATAAFAVGIGAFYYDRGRRRAGEQVTELSDSGTSDNLANGQNQQGELNMNISIWGCQKLGLDSSDTVTLGMEGTDRLLSSPERSICKKSSDVKYFQNLEFRGDALMCDGTLLSTVSQEATFDVFVPNPSENVETEKTGVTALSFLPEGSISEHKKKAESIQNILKKDKNETTGVPTDSGTSQNLSNESAVTTSCFLSQGIIDSRHLDETAIEADSLIPISEGIFNQSCKEYSSLHEDRLLFDFRLLSEIPQRFTIQDSYLLNSQKQPLNDSSLASGAESAGQRNKITCSKNLTRSKQNRPTQETNRRQRSRYKKPSGTFGEESAGTVYRKKIEKVIEKVPEYPRTKEKPVKNAKDPLLSLSFYNYLLRDGRLKECIELLETMERKGLLDMDKVYHARFLKTCKTQKAVKEAIGFTNLIKNPTLSTFNMLLSVCASSQDYEGALQVLLHVKKAGLQPDCKLYTTLISTCAKSGKVDAMFEVFHEMVNAEVEPTVHTYSALIDGCARAQQVAKAFGAYGIMRSKNVKPDRVVFNSLITACGQSRAVDRAFDVLAEMMAEPQPIYPDHVTIGALMNTCTIAGQADRAREVYKMLDQYKIKGTKDVYTIGVRSCSLTGDLEFALAIYNDMKQNEVDPDEMFFSTLMDVVGHAGKVEIGFEILQEAQNQGIELGSMSYSSLMGACSTAKNWQKALQLYEEIKEIKLIPTVSTFNALITCLCNGGQLLKACAVLDEMKKAGVCPNTVTYSILFVACEKQGEIELGFNLLSQAEQDGISPNLTMCGCLTGLCLKRFEKACSLGEPILSNSTETKIQNKWTTWALMTYRKTISAGVTPSTDAFSQVLGCLKYPNDTSLRNKIIENSGLPFDTLKYTNTCSLLSGFGEYDPRSFSVFEEASSWGVVPSVSFKSNLIVVDVRNLKIHTAQVYILTTLKGLKHRLAAGVRLPNLTILLPIEKTTILSNEAQKMINVSGRVGQAVGAMLRRLGLHYQGDISCGKIRINGLALRRWFKPKLKLPALSGKTTDLASTQARLAKEIANQQRSIRGDYSLSIE